MNTQPEEPDLFYKETSLDTERRVKQEVKTHSRSKSFAQNILDGLKNKMQSLKPGGEMNLLMKTEPKQNVRSLSSDHYCPIVTEKSDDNYENDNIFEIMTSRSIKNGSNQDPINPMQDIDLAPRKLLFMESDRPPSPKEDHHPIPRAIHKENSKEIEQNPPKARISIEKITSEGSQDGQGSNSPKSTIEINKIKFIAWRKIKLHYDAIAFNHQVDELLDKRVSRIMDGFDLKNRAIKTESKFVIHPNSAFKKIWDIMILLIIIYFIFLSPYRWAQAVDPSEYRISDIILDVINLADAILLLFTAITKKHDLIFFRRKIIRHYIRTFLFFDIVSIPPYYLIDRDLYVLKIFRVAHYARCMRAIRKLSLNMTHKAIIVIKSFKFILWILALFNLLISIWIFIGRFWTENGKSWIYEAGINLDSEHNFEIYIHSAYFIVTTGTTIGFGDLTPKSIQEYAICMILELSGILLIALYQGKIIYLLQNSNLLFSATREMNMDLEVWLAEREMAKKNMSSSQEDVALGDPQLLDVMKKIYDYFRFEKGMDFASIASESEFFNRLDPKTQDLISHMAFDKFIKMFYIFFENVEDYGFEKDIFLAMKPKGFLPGQVIVKKGTKPKGIYFILSGRVFMKSDNISFRCLDGRTYFGDSCMINVNSTMDFVAGEDPVKCLFVNRKALSEIGGKYPMSYLNLQKIAYKRISFNKEVKEEYKRAMKNSIHEFMTSFHKEELKRSIFAEAKEYVAPKQNAHKEPDELIIEIVDDVQIPENHVRKKSSMFNSNYNYKSLMLNQFLAYAVPEFLTHCSPFQSAQKQFSDKASAQYDISETVEEQLTPYKLEVFSQALSELKTKATPKDEVINHQPLAIPAQVRQLIQYTEYLDEEVKSQEETEPSDSDEETEPQDSDSDRSDGDELNNSLEVPTETMPPTFQDTEELEYVSDYLKARIEIMNYRLDRLRKSLWEGVIKENKHLKEMKHILKKRDIL